MSPEPIAILLASIAPTLNRMVDGGKVSTLALVTGIAAHDLYHAGQIQLLKRLGS